MSDDDKKTDVNAVDKLDFGKPVDRVFEQLGQFSYTFFVDQQTSSPAVLPSNPVLPGQPVSSRTSGQNGGNSGFTHPVVQREQAENSINPALKYQREMAETVRKAAVESSDSPPPKTECGTFEGAVERQARGGFSSRFNFARSLDFLFHRIDTNCDGRLSKNELDAALADGTLTGDDELLLILLLRHIGDIARQTPAASADPALNVTYESIRSYNRWPLYLPLGSTQKSKNRWQK